ncbi:MAG TPA: sigma-70 family RNA polymerase sigma factor [Bryobacteraceae bacterium]|nr:sigma-70 family RNA polymerase sigma factor [Bryobacteraceae bacterium]
MSFTAVNRLSGEVKASADPREQQWQRLLHDNGAALGRLAGSHVRSASDRDDLLQEIAIALWQSLPSFRGECSERTFLFRIAHNRAIAYLTRNAPRAERADDDLEIKDPSPDPETFLVREEGGKRLADAVRALPLLYRQVVVLMLEGLEYGEIAEVMGISESNVGVRLNRARQMLRRMMTK